MEGAHKLIIPGILCGSVAWLGGKSYFQKNDPFPSYDRTSISQIVETRTDCEGMISIDGTEHKIQTVLAEQAPFIKFEEDGSVAVLTIDGRRIEMPANCQPRPKDTIQVVQVAYKP